VGLLLLANGGAVVVEEVLERVVGDEAAADGELERAL
jgi:hypothetical protein